MNAPFWITVFAALLTPTIAVFGAIIAYRQWRTAQNKLKLDLFDRRLEIYLAARRYLGSVMTSGKTSLEQEMAFLAGVRGTRWLYDEEIEIYLNKVLWPKMCQLSCVQAELVGMPAGEERGLKVQEQGDLKQWLVDQVKVLDDKFAPFLQLRH